MAFTRTVNTLLGAFLFIFTVSVTTIAYAQEKFRVSYGGYNETAAPMWVGIDKGLFKKYGIDASMIQVRSGALSIAALVSREVEAVWPAQSTILSTVAGGIKLGCIASATNKIPRQLIARKEIKSIEELRGRIIGVQSIGGGFWLQTMIILDHLGVDPDKHGLKMRVIGDGPVIAQALLNGNIDAAALTYSLSEAPLKAGFTSLADAAALKAPYQGPSICALKEVIANRQDFFLRLTKGLVEATAYILDANNKSEVMKTLQKHLRLQKADEVEASYKVLRLMATLDIAPNPAAYKSVQRIVATVNPKIAQVDVEQIMDSSFVRTLESGGFIAEQRKKAR
ncbi:MAG TPA: ABC transporter substrate-binding protein [Candidatus Binatia bacterium]|nr:ABC transporter substrate-binding protein [Candidatus Binatia bacterium]